MKKRFFSIFVFIVSLFFFSCSNSVSDANGKIVFNLPYGAKSRAETVDGKPAYYAFKVSFFNQNYDEGIVKYGFSGEQIKLENAIAGEWQIVATAIRVYNEEQIELFKTEGFDTAHEKIVNGETSYASFYGEMTVSVIAGRTTNVPLVLKKEIEYQPEEKPEITTETYYELVVNAPIPETLTYESLLEYLKEIEYQVKVTTYSSNENELMLVGEPAYYDVESNNVIVSGVDKSYFGTVPIEFDLNWKDEQNEPILLNKRLVIPVFYEIQPYEYSKKSYEYNLKQNNVFELDCSIPEEDNEPVALTYFSKAYKHSINEDDDLILDNVNTLAGRNDEVAEGEIIEETEETGQDEPGEPLTPIKPGYDDSEVVEPEYEIKGTKIQLRRKLLYADWYRNDLISADDDQSSEPFERNDSFILSVDTSEPGEYEFWCEYVLGGDIELVDSYLIYSNMVSPVYKVIIEKDEPVDPEEIVKLTSFDVIIPENYVPVTYSKIDYSNFTYKTTYSHEKEGKTWETEDTVSDYLVEHTSVLADQFGYVPVEFSYDENDTSFTKTVQIPVLYDLKNPEYSSNSMEIEAEPDSTTELFVNPEYKLENPIKLFYYFENAADDKLYESVIIEYAVLKSSTWYSLDKNLDKTEITNTGDKPEMLTINTGNAGVYKYSCVAEYEPRINSKDGEESEYSKEIVPFIVTHAIESPLYIVTVEEPVETRRLNYLSIALPKSYSNTAPFYDTIDYSDFTYTAYYSCSKGNSTWEEQKTLSVNDFIYTTVAYNEFGHVPVTFSYTDPELGSTADIKIYIPVAFNWLEGDRKPKLNTEDAEYKLPVYGYRQLSIEEAGTVIESLVYYPDDPEEESVSLSFTNEATGYYWYKNDTQVGSGLTVLAGSDKEETNVYYAKLTFEPVFMLKTDKAETFTPNGIYLALSEENYSTSGNMTVKSFDYEYETLVYNATTEKYEAYTGNMVPGETYTIQIVNEALDSSNESLVYLNNNISWYITELNESDYSVSLGAVTFTLPEKTYTTQTITLSAYCGDKLLSNITPITITIPSLSNTTGSVEVTTPQAPSVNELSITLADSDGNAYRAGQDTGIIQVQAGARVVAQVQTSESSFSCVWFVNGEIQREQNGSSITIDTEDYSGFVNVSCTVKDAATNKAAGYAEVNFMVVR